MIRASCLALALCVALPARGDTKDTIDPQFVAADDWVFISYPENMYSQNGQIRLGKLGEKPAEVAGAKSFWVPAESRAYDAKTFFKTRMARPQDLVLGRRVIYPLRDIHSESDKPDAWGYRRIIDLVDAPKGKLIVHGSSDPEVELALLRVIVGGDPDPTIAMSGKEDAHHFHPE